MPSALFVPVMESSNDVPLHYFPPPWQSISSAIATAAHTSAATPSAPAVLITLRFTT